MGVEQVKAAAWASAARRLKASPPPAAFRLPAWRNRWKAFHPYQARNAAPASASTRAICGRSPRARAMPKTPAMISAASASAQNSTTAADMLAPQALAQHKGVLRADGHDQAQAQGKALQKCGGDGPCGGGQERHGAHSQGFGVRTRRAAPVDSDRAALHAGLMRPADRGGGGIGCDTIRP
jgi:hypothetical protein